MTDINEFCEVFLKFVYDNNMIPEGVVKILKDYDRLWDLRLICRLLAYQNKFYTYNDRDKCGQELNDYIYQATPFRNNEWLQDKMVNLGLFDLIDKINYFANNCYSNKKREEETIKTIETIKYLISRHSNKEIYLK